MKNKNFQTQQVHFSKNARGVSKIYHEVLLLVKFLQTKPQVKNMNSNYYDLYYIVIRSRDEYRDIDNEIIDDENDIISPNHYIGIKTRGTILR